MVDQLEIVLLIIIMAASVSLIYNAFAMSVTERSRQLGMLAGLGATKKQKRQSVYFEAFLIGSIGIPLGILAGIGGKAVLTIIVTAVITLFISAYIPAKRASGLSPINAIRQNDDIKLTRQQIKISALTSKWFGMEGNLALKNLKRNKKRYRATVVTMIISLALFVSVSTFVQTSKQVINISLQEENYQFQIYGADEYLEDCAKLPGITKSNTLYTVLDDFIVPNNDLDTHTDYISVLKDYFNEGDAYERLEDFLAATPWHIRITAMDDADLERYMSENNIEGHGLPDGSAILLNQIQISNDMKSKTPILDIENGARLKVYLAMERLNADGFYEETYSDDYSLDMEIAAVTTRPPMGMGISGYINMKVTIQLIVSKNYLQQILSYIDSVYEALENTTDEEETYIIAYSVMRFLYLNAEKPLTLLEDLETYKRDLPPIASFNVYSQYQSYRDYSYMLTVTMVFCYGFLVLMACICAANILNTTSAGIRMRRGEFAMLKSIGMTPKSFHKMILYESLFLASKQSHTDCRLDL